MMEWGMTWTTILIALDIVGILVCASFVIVLYRKRKKADKNLLPQETRGGAFRSIPGKGPQESGFNQIFDNVLRYPQSHSEKESRMHPTDPYEEARWLAEMGMSIQGIAERVDLPRCEIELIIDLCRVRTSHNIKGRKLAEAV